MLIEIPHPCGSADEGGSPSRLVVSDHSPAFEGDPLLMLTWEDDVDIHALRRQGWTISAIARHIGRDRKTVRDYLNGQRDPGVRKRAASIRSHRSSTM